MVKNHCGNTITWKNVEITVDFSQPNRKRERESGKGRKIQIFSVQVSKGTYEYIFFHIFIFPHLNIHTVWYNQNADVNILLRFVFFSSLFEFRFREFFESSKLSREDKRYKLPWSDSIHWNLIKLKFNPKSYLWSRSVQTSEYLFFLDSKYFFPGVFDLQASDQRSVSLANSKFKFGKNEKSVSELLLLLLLLFHTFFISLFVKSARIGKEYVRQIWNPLFHQNIRIRMYKCGKIPDYFHGRLAAFWFVRMNLTILICSHHSVMSGNVASNHKFKLFIHMKPDIYCGYTSVVSSPVNLFLSSRHDNEKIWRMVKRQRSTIHYKLNVSSEKEKVKKNAFILLCVYG